MDLDPLFFHLVSVSTGVQGIFLEMCLRGINPVTLLGEGQKHPCPCYKSIVKTLFEVLKLLLSHRFKTLVLYWGRGLEYPPRSMLSRYCKKSFKALKPPLSRRLHISRRRLIPFKAISQNTH